MAKANGEMTARAFKQALRKLDVSLAQAGAALGTSRQQVWRYSQGQQPVAPPVRRLIRVMLRYRISPAEVAKL